MSKFFKKAAIILCFTLFTGCTAKTPPETSFNAYLPPSSELSEEDFTLPLEAEVSPQNNVWDVSDVDISYVDLSRKLIAFTFDDGPGKTMENILAAFTDHNERNPDCRATATFFLNGLRITEEMHPLLHTAHILGCELGNHTYHHHNLTTLPDEELQAEIERTDEILCRIDGKTHHLLRAPFGAINDTVKAHLQTPVINWTIDTLDWTGTPEETIYDNVYTARFSGAIVLFHDGYSHTVNALKRLFADLTADGYQVVSVSALAKAHGCTLYNGKEYIRARKQ